VAIARSDCYNIGYVYPHGGVARKSCAVTELAVRVATPSPNCAVVGNDYAVVHASGNGCSARGNACGNREYEKA